MRLARTPGGRRQLLIGGVAAYLIFEVVFFLAGVLVRPVHSGLASGFIGAMIGGIVWWLLFTVLASRVQRRRASKERAFNLLVGTLYIRRLGEAGNHLLATSRSTLDKRKEVQWIQRCIKTSLVVSFNLTPLSWRDDRHAR